MAPIINPIVHKNYIDWTWRLLYHYLREGPDIPKIRQVYELLANLLYSGSYLPPHYADVILLEGLRVSL